MTSNIEAIRAAEALIPRLTEQMQALREEALRDGNIDDQEQAEITRVEGKITDAQRLIVNTRQIWERNKAQYEAMRPGLDAGLREVADCANASLRADQNAVADAARQTDQAAAEQDYARALDLVRQVEGLIAHFRSLLSRLDDNARLEEMSPEDLADVNLCEGGTEEVFSEEYMEDLATADFPGEGDANLADLMTEIERGLTGPRRGEVMEALAGIVGIPPSASELDGDYGRFLIIRRQQDAIGAENNSGEVPGLDEDRHPDFRASRGQLMFGRVLGDAFGIHEVFAALLSPTGGLVGPGNDLIPGMVDSPHLSPDNPVALHGTVHDAAGYLKSYHNEGPGYNYRGDMAESVATSAIELLPDDLANTLLPLTGQLSGIEYWIWESGDEYAMARLNEAAVFLEGELSEARDQMAEEIADMLTTIDEATQMAENAAETAQREVEAGIEAAEREVQQAVEAAEAEVRDAVDAAERELREAAGAAEREVHEAIETAEAEVRDAVDSAAREVLEAAGAAEREMQQAVETAEAEVQNVVDAFEEAAQQAETAAVETYQEASAGARAMGEAAAETLDNVASFIWG